MLYCGRNWRPLSVDRVVETFPTSTRVAKVDTDAGLAFLKGMGNPAGDGALASEIVAGELATLIGLRVPEFAVVTLDLDIPMAGHGHMGRGPAFVSRVLAGAVGDGSDTVLFDTWVRNFDRYPPDGEFGGGPNWDNLFFEKLGRKYELVALDHSHCFVQGDIETDLRDPSALEDDRIFGLFPEFAPFIDEASVTAAAEAISRVDAAAVWEIVASVPAAWGPTAAARAAWVDFIMARAALVAEAAPSRLLNQPRLDI